MAAPVFAVACVAALLMVAMPVDAGAEEAKANRYRAEFYSRIGGMSPSAEGIFYSEDESYEMTLREVADIYAQQMLALESSTDHPRGGRATDKGDKDGGATESDSDPSVFAVGDFHLFETLYIDGSNPAVACSDLQENRHYTAAVRLGPDEYAGAAYSDVSTYATGLGVLTWGAAGQSSTYNLEVHYAGVSSFACAEFPHPGGRSLLVNFPAVFAGFVIGVAD